MIQAIWVEIPVNDLERALAFYRAVFQLDPVEINDDGVRRTATLFRGTAEGRAGVSLNQTRNFPPSSQGTLVYYDIGTDLAAHLERVTAAGGTVVEPKTAMGEAGYYALVRDTEGNTLALYSAT